MQVAGGVQLHLLTGFEMAINWLTGNATRNSGIILLGSGSMGGEVRYAGIGMEAPVMEMARQAVAQALDMMNARLEVLDALEKEETLTEVLVVHTENFLITASIALVIVTRSWQLDRGIEAEVEAEILHIVLTAASVLMRECEMGKETEALTAGQGWGKMTETGVWMIQGVDKSSATTPEIGTIVVMEKGIRIDVPENAVIVVMFVTEGVATAGSAIVSTAAVDLVVTGNSVVTLLATAKAGMVKGNGIAKSAIQRETETVPVGNVLQITQEIGLEITILMDAGAMPVTTLLMEDTHCVNWTERNGEETTVVETKSESLMVLSIDTMGVTVMVLGMIIGLRLVADRGDGVVGIMGAAEKTDEATREVGTRSTAELAGAGISRHESV